MQIEHQRVSAPEGVKFVLFLVKITILGLLKEPFSVKQAALNLEGNIPV